MNSGTFSDYVVFVDESGDHGLHTIDDDYPLFVLVFIIVKKQDYIDTIVPSFQRLKYKYWGHDQIVFHENEIRKEKNAFSLLRSSKSLRDAFYEELAGIIANSPFEFTAAVIQKNRLREKYATPYNPYEISMLFCMEQATSILLNSHQANRTTHIIVEGRGTREDKELELEFRRICDHQRNWGYKRVDFTKTPYELICSNKHSNSSGLQLADLIARPIGLSILRPQQKNRAAGILKPKWRHVKIFP